MGAIKCYNKALEIDPNNTRIWFLKAEAFILGNQYPKALECYEKIAEIDPDSEHTLKTQQNKPVYTPNQDSLQVLSNVGIFLIIGALCFIGGIISLIFSIIYFTWSGLINSIILIMLGGAWFAIAKKFSFIRDYLKSRDYGNS